MKVELQYFYSKNTPPEYLKVDSFPFYGKPYFGNKSVCSYQFRPDNEEGTIYRTPLAPCYANLTFNPRTNYKYLDTSLYILHEKTYDASLAYYKFLIEDERSPFRKYQKYFSIQYDSEGRVSHLTTKLGEIEMNSELMCFYIATRAPYEMSGNVVVFHELTKKGVDPRVAFLASFYITYIEGTLFYSPADRAHSMFGPMFGPPHYDAFFHGKFAPHVRNKGLYEYIFHGNDPIPEFIGVKPTYKGPFAYMYDRLTRKSNSEYVIELKIDDVVKYLTTAFNKYL